MRAGVIYATVGLVTFDVFIAVLEGGNQEDDDKREDDKAGRDGGKFGKELEDGDGQEKSAVGELVGNDVKALRSKRRRRRKCGRRIVCAAWAMYG